MARTRNAIGMALVGMFISSIMLSPVLACGPFFDEAFFSYSFHPDFPLTEFAKGNLGIIKPTYSRSYLVAAYCYLTGRPLGAAEQREYERLWQYRLVNSAFSDSQTTSSDTTNDPAAGWLKARGQIADTPLDKIETFRSVSAGENNFNTFENCSKEAFVAATSTLSKYETKYGKQSQITKDWVNAQDKVFCHCGAGRYDYQTKQNMPEGPFPESLPKDTESTLKADRNYQIACAHFYAMHYDQAEQEFVAISQDTSSSWKDMGLYLAARCMIRKGTMPDTVDMASLIKASHLLEDVLKDSSLARLHDSAGQLLNFITLRTQPDERLLVLAQEILDPTKTKNLFQNLYDYTFLLDQYYPDAPSVFGSEPANQRPIPGDWAKNDLTDWVTIFQTFNKGEARTKALKKWRETRALPWLIAALSKTTSRSAEEEDLIAAACAIPTTSAAYVTVSYYLTDLFIKSKQNNLASQRLLSVLPLNLPPSSRNGFLTLQMSIAPTLKDFLKLAVRHPVGTFVDDSGSESPYEVQPLLSLPAYPHGGTPCFVNVAADVLNNNVPLKMLTDAAEIADVPPAPHFDLVQAAWTRAVLLNRDDLAVKISPLMKKLRPQVAPLIDAYIKATTPMERRFISSFVILKNPGMRPYVTSGIAREVDFARIEDYGDNWWGAKGMTRDNGQDEKSKQSSQYPPFLNAGDLSSAVRELKALKSLGDAPNILTANILNYSRSHPGDPRIPEALHRCVKATKFGTTDDQTSDFSKQAFQLLHRHYGKSVWAGETPYYY